MTSRAADETVPGELRLAAAVQAALDLFNAGDYRQAVDAFEVPYHEDTPPRRPLWLGLVRAAAALHHAERGNPASARRLLASAREVLVGADSSLAPGGPALDLSGLIAELTTALAPLLSPAPGGARRIESRPRLRFVSAA